jgi:hypothetical protein
VGARGKEKQMTEQELQDLLQALLTGLPAVFDDSAMADKDDLIESVRTFKEAGIFTHDKGLVVTTVDRREYQITIVRTG